MSLDDLWLSNLALRRRFPDGQAPHYGLEAELEACIQAGVARAHDEGLLTDADLRGRGRA